MVTCALCNGYQYVSNFTGGITVCAKCFNGAKNIRAVLEKLRPDDCKSSTNAVLQNGSYPEGVFGNALKSLEAVKESEEQLRFLGGYSDAYRNQVHCDIKLKPGNNGPSIPAHRSLLVTRSEIFRNMLDSNGCKASESDETITLDEMSFFELESFLEFLYSGELPKEKLEKNVNALTRAAHKYQIPFLQKYCEKQMCLTLNSSNVLDVLEISDSCCNQSLKDTALNFIAEHMNDIVFSDKFDAFTLKNPQLAAQITRVSTTRYEKIINQGNHPNKISRDDIYELILDEI